MEIKLHQHEGVDTNTKERVVVGDCFGPQYRVYVDGIGVGFVGSRPDAPVLMTETRFSKAELEEIRKEVERLRGVPVPSINQPPKIDPELLRVRDDGIEADDFN